MKDEGSTRATETQIIIRPATALVMAPSPAVETPETSLVRAASRPVNDEEPIRAAYQPNLRIEDHHDAPPASSAFNASFAVDEGDNCTSVRFFNQYINPAKQHDANVNALLYAATTWMAQSRELQQHIVNNTFFFQYNAIDPHPFPLVEIATKDNRPILVLVQHPLLAQSPEVRRDLLHEWYCSNDFIVSFDLKVSKFARAKLERGLKLLGPTITPMLFTPMAGVISSRLRIHYGNYESGVTFATL